MPENDPAVFSGGVALKNTSALVKESLTVEGLVLKRLGFDSVPLHDLIQNRMNSTASLTSECPEVLAADKSQSLANLVQDFSTAVTSAAALLHKAVEAVPQNRPFSGSSSVERLILENLTLMNKIVEYDKADSAQDVYLTPSQ